MTEQEVIKLWRSGLSKNKLAEIYKREYNNRIKIIRLDVRNRHAGRFITNYESLAYIERIILKYLKEGEIWEKKQ